MDSLSADSIYLICEFLETRDIEHFKMTSAFTSVIIFDIFQTYRIGIFNMNELIEQKEYKYPKHGHLNLNKKIKVNFIKPYLKYSVLMHKYGLKYGIEPVANMLILKSFKSHGFTMSKGNAYDNDYHIYNNSLCKSQIVKNMLAFSDGKVEKKRQFFVFDKRKIFVLNNDTHITKAMAVESADHYNIVLLQYFDIYEQRLANIHFLWFDSHTGVRRFEDYIINELYAIYVRTYSHLSQQWCLHFLQTINRMRQMQSGGDAFEPLINIYFRKRVNVNCIDYIRYTPQTYRQRCDNANDNGMDKDFAQIAFELNAKHAYFDGFNGGNNNNQKFPFYGSVSEYVSDQTCKECIQMTDIRSEEERGVIVTPLTTFGMIKRQICAAILNEGVLNMENMEIFRCKSHSNSSFMSLWNANAALDTLSNNRQSYSVICAENNREKINKNHTKYQYKFEIFPFVSRQALTTQKYHIYNVLFYEKEIDFGDDDCFDNYTNVSSSFYSEIDDESFRHFHVKYDTFTSETALVRINIKHFLDSMIENMRHAMYGNEYSYFIHKYVQSHTYSFVIFEESSHENQAFIQFFDNDSFYSHDSLSRYAAQINYFNVNVLILRTFGSEEEKESILPIIVRFNTIQKEETEIGFPVKVWIDSQCTPQAIVNKCFKNVTKNKFRLTSCESSSKNISINDSVYKTIFHNNNGHKCLLPQIIITLRIIID